MDLAQQKHSIELESKLNQALEKNKSLETQLTEALMKKEQAENNGKLALAKLQEGHEKEVEDIQQKHKDSQETEQRNHDIIVKEIKNELKLATTELTTIKGKMQAKEEEVEEVNNMLKKKENELGEEQQKHEVTVAHLIDVEKRLDIEKKELEKKEQQLDFAKENIRFAMDIANDLNKNAVVNETQNEREIRDDREGVLDWTIFGLKFVVELTLGILEFWATKKQFNILITAIFLAVVSLTLSVVEICICFKRKSVIHNKKVSWVKLPWIPQLYSFFAILGELIFYICKLTQRHPVHVSLYTCGFHVCLLGKLLTKRYKNAAATRERARERATRERASLGGGATVV